MLLFGLTPALSHAQNLLYNQYKSIKSELLMQLQAAQSGSGIR